MDSIKKVNVNNKALKDKKFRVIKLITTLTLTTTIGISAMLLGHQIAKAQEKNQIETVLNYYGENSYEYEILDYLDISSKLNKLKLDNYEVDSNLYDLYNVSNKLKSVSDINLLIDKFKESPSSFSAKDISKQNEYIELVLNLKRQEKLVNTYIYNVGYSTAYQNVSAALKKYVAETLGIENPNNIKLYKIGNDSVKVVNNIGKTTEIYEIKNSVINNQRKHILSGINSMVNTNTDYDITAEDNDEYNSTRNDYIRRALAKSAFLEEELNTKKLYNNDLMEDSFIGEINANSTHKLK